MWKDKRELPKDGGPIRLRFMLERAHLYSFMAGPSAKPIDEPAALPCRSREGGGESLAQAATGRWRHCQRQAVSRHFGDEGIYTSRQANQRSLWLLDTETGRTHQISPRSLGEVTQASYWIQ